MKSLSYRVFLVLLALTLGACSTVHEAVAPVSGTASASDEPEAADAGLMSEADNPYLKQRGSVSAAAQRRFDSANQALARGDLEVARTDLEWLVQNHPRLSGPYLNLALLYQQLGDADGAERYFQAAVEVNSRNLTAYNQYAVFLREEGRFDQAEQVYLAALRVWDAHADTHRNLGVLYDLYRGDRQRALQHFYRYQALTGNQDRAVAGWIADLERQLMAVVQEG